MILNSKMSAVIHALYNSLGFFYVFENLNVLKLSVTKDFPVPVMFTHTKTVVLTLKNIPHLMFHI